MQYGLTALRDGVITPAEFLDLNAKVGSWKEPAQMVTEGFPFVGALQPRDLRPLELAQHEPLARRRRHARGAPDGSLDAIHAAYRRGMRFDGHIDIPVIDWRHYLEHQLDMHHSHQSFATRRRLQLARGNADNQVIWFTDARPAARPSTRRPRRSR